MEESTDGGGRLVVAVALSGGSKSKAIVNWAIEKFVNEGNNVSFKLLHVFPRITGVPTAMGNLIPLLKVRDDIASAYKKEVEWQKTEMLLPYQNLCSSNKVSTDIVLLEADEISSAISLEVAKFGIKHLVIGASSSSLFSRKVKGQLISSLISDITPGFCTVYVVSKGKLESLRPSQEAIDNCLDDYTDTSASGDSAFSSSRYSSSTLDPGSSTSESPFASPSRSIRRMEPLPSVRLTFSDTMHDVSHWKSQNLRDDKNALSYFTGNSMVGGSMISRSSSITSYTEESDSFISEKPSTLYSASSLKSYQNLGSINQEIERLRMELRHVRGMYLMSQNEIVDVSKKLSELRLEEAKKPKETNEKEEKIKEPAKLEKKKVEASRIEAKYTKECATKEMYKRRESKLISVQGAVDQARDGPITPPNHFICPILKIVMDDPCVAADGYTYDRRAIEMWLQEDDASPTTNFPLSNKNLIPNNTLRYAIMEWKAKRKSLGNSLRYI